MLGSRRNLEMIIGAALAACAVGFIGVQDSVIVERSAAAIVSLRFSMTRRTNCAQECVSPPATNHPSS